MARILVVEDQPIIALSIAEGIADLRHEVVGPVRRLGEAMALAEGPLDAAVIEARIAGETTAALAGRLRARALPFIVVTGDDPATLGQAFEGGVFLFKPFLFETFRALLARLTPAGD